jgi:RNA polymerase sigma factor (sigma-70 family)
MRTDAFAEDDADGRSHSSRYGHELAELVRYAAKKDWVAWHELVKRFGYLVLHAASMIGLNSSDAADAAQLTWFRLYEHLEEIREPEHLPAWLAVTARREALRIAYGLKRYVLCAEPDTDYGIHHTCAVTDSYPIEGDYSPDIEAALCSLPPRYEQLLRVLMCEDCPRYTEVAEQLGIPIGSIGPMRMRALRLLRRALEVPDRDQADRDQADRDRPDAEVAWSPAADLRFDQRRYSSAPPVTRAGQIR